MKFTFFKDAMNFAKTHSVKNGVTTRIYRIDDSWEVETNNFAVASSVSIKGRTPPAGYPKFVAYQSTFYKPYEEPKDYRVFTGPISMRGAYAVKPSENPNPLTEEELKRYKSERNTIDCACMGEVENCYKCFGKGSYITNGFGEIVDS